VIESVDIFQKDTVNWIADGGEWSDQSHIFQKSLTIVHSSAQNNL
jgi:hypothetical protein